MRKIKKESLSIAVAGCQPRIGTTTQAFQFVKYLKLMGYTVCYIEMNSEGYIEGMRELYKDMKVNKKRRCLSYEDIDLFSQEHIAEVKKMDYDFLVKDYGSAASGSFEKLSFLDQNYRIFCGGVKPNEIGAAARILADPVYTANGYIFSFVPNSDRNGIKEMMEEKGECTFFADYVPDAFQYSATANYIYRTLLKL